MKSKSLITIALLAFVVISLMALIAKELGDKSTTDQSDTSSMVSSTTPNRLVVYYFHGNVRCVTCRNIEAYTREAIETAFADALSSGSMEFHVINVETPRNEHYMDEYQLYSSSVVLALFKDNQQISWKNLDQVWERVHDKDSFVSYIQNETAAMMPGGA